MGSLGRCVSEESEKQSSKNEQHKKHSATKQRDVRFNATCVRTYDGKIVMCPNGIHSALFLTFSISCSLSLSVNGWAGFRSRMTRRWQVRWRRSCCSRRPTKQPIYHGVLYKYVYTYICTCTFTQACACIIE